SIDIKRDTGDIDLCRTRTVSLLWRERQIMSIDMQKSIDVRCLLIGVRIQRRQLHANIARREGRRECPSDLLDRRCRWRIAAVRRPEETRARSNLQPRAAHTPFDGVTYVH